MKQKQFFTAVVFVLGISVLVPLVLRAQNNSIHPIPWWLRDIPRGTDYDALRQSAEDEEQTAEGVQEAVVKNIEKNKAYIERVKTKLIEELEKEKNNARRAEIQKAIETLSKMTAPLERREELRASEEPEDRLRADMIQAEIERKLEDIINILRRGSVSRDIQHIITSLMFFKNYELRHQAGALADPLRVEMGIVKDRRVMDEYLNGIKEQIETAKNTLGGPAFTGFIGEPPEWAKYIIPRRLYESPGYKKYKELRETLETAESRVDGLQKTIREGVMHDEFWKEVYAQLIVLSNVLDGGGLRGGLYPYIVKDPQGDKAAQELLNAAEKIRLVLFHLGTTYADLDEWPYDKEPSVMAKLREENEELENNIQAEKDAIKKIKEVNDTVEEQIDEYDARIKDLKNEIRDLDRQIKS